MAAVDLPKKCTHLSLLKSMQEAGIFDQAWTGLVIRVPPGCFVSSSAIVFLCTWGQLCCEGGKQIRFMGDQDVLRYLSRMDVFQCIDFEFEETFQRQQEVGRFIPVKLIEDDKSVLEGSNAICDLVLRNFDNGREFVPAIEWAVYELVDNIQLHAETPVPGVLCAQFYPKRNRIDISICDMGRGIKASLEESIPIWGGHGSAISKALERGVTRDKKIGQGNGLAGSLEICRLNKGRFNIWSGDANFTVYKGEDRGFQKIPLIPGTGLFLSLDTNYPVDLGETFIGEDSWSYIDYLGDQVTESGGLLIKEECVHTGSRQAASSLRRKILALLPDMEVPLVLDFTGVEQASSSFLDELLGKLIEEYGINGFKRSITIVNAPELLVNMINVVVHQRLVDLVG